MVQYNSDFVCIKGRYGWFWNMPMPNILGMSIYIKVTTMTDNTKILPTIELNPHHKRLCYIAQYLKELRLNEGYTQIEAASYIGINRGSLHNAENGHNVTINTILKIADFYELSLSEFFMDVE